MFSSICIYIYIFQCNEAILNSSEELHFLRWVDQAKTREAPSMFMSQRNTWKNNIPTKSFEAQDYCSQQNWLLFEDPHNYLQQGLASAQQGLEHGVGYLGLGSSLGHSSRLAHDGSRINVVFEPRQDLQRYIIQSPRSKETGIRSFLKSYVLKNVKILTFFNIF